MSGPPFPQLQWMVRLPGGGAWLAALPRLLDKCVSKWSLREVGDAYAGSYVSLVLPVTSADGTDAVLKLQFPHRESEHEAAALEAWNGDGAIRLLAHDPERHALLVEQCVPGTHLADIGADAALDVFVDLLPRLWAPSITDDRFGSLADEAAHWIDELPASWERAGRPFERALVDAAISQLRDLAGSQGEQVLVHQDLHSGNVLRAQREPWLVIDPKPLVGEREFAIAPFVRGYELGHSETDVLRRLDRLTADLGLDRQRARGWAFSQTLAWSIDVDVVFERPVQTARWLR